MFEQKRVQTTLAFGALHCRRNGIGSGAYLMIVTYYQIKVNHLRLGGAIVRLRPVLSRMINEQVDLTRTHF